MAIAPAQIVPPRSSKLHEHDHVLLGRMAMSCRWKFLELCEPQSGAVPEGRAVKIILGERGALIPEGSDV